MAMMGGWTVWLGIGTATRFLQRARNGLDFFLARLYTEKTHRLVSSSKRVLFCVLYHSGVLPCSRGIWPAIQGLAPVPIL